MLPLVGSTIVPPGLSVAGRLGGVDHPLGDPVLHRAARVEVLDLGEHLGARAVDHLVESHERRVADQLDDRVGDLHWPHRRSREPQAAASAAEAPQRAAAHSSTSVAIVRFVVLVVAAGRVDDVVVVVHDPVREGHRRDACRDGRASHGSSRARTAERGDLRMQPPGWSASKQRTWDAFHGDDEVGPRDVVLVDLMRPVRGEVRVPADDLSKRTARSPRHRLSVSRMSARRTKLKRRA